MKICITNSIGKKPIFDDYDLDAQRKIVMAFFALTR